MDRGLQFRRGTMGLASTCPSTRSSVVTVAGCMVKATVDTETCQGKVYGVLVRKQALGQRTLPVTALTVLVL